MEVAGARHIDAHRQVAILIEHGGLGVFEDDVVFGVAPVELALYLRVPGRRACPLPPSSPRVIPRLSLHRAVGPNASGAPPTRRPE